MMKTLFFNISDMTKIYFAGPPPFCGEEYLELMEGRNVLVTFGEHRRSIFRDISIFKSAILDSGAYSVRTLGKPIKLGDYIQYLQIHGSEFAWYANLDVIGDVNETFSNFVEMRDCGLKPVPVFHGEEPFEILNLYREVSPIVALGSTPGWSKKTRHLWLDKIFNNYPHRYHLFRGTDPCILENYPFESTDSSTWARASSYGMIPFPKGKRLRMTGLSAFERSRIWVRYFELLEGEVTPSGKQANERTKG